MNIETITQIKSTVEKWDDQIQQIARDMLRLVTERDQLKARVAELERDKVRLDWLERERADLVEDGKVWHLYSFERNACNHDSPRQAIDAAMKGGK